MRYETTRDLLQQASELHAGLSRYYQRLAGESEREKVRLLLDYLARHEARLADVVTRVGTESAEVVRNAWFGFELDSEFIRCIPPARPVVDMSVDEIVALAIQLDDCIADLYQLIAIRSELPEVKEVFASLVTLERAEKMRMVRQAMRLDDL